LSPHDSTASQFYLSVRRHAVKGVTGTNDKQGKEDFCDAHLPFFNGLVIDKQPADGRVAAPTSVMSAISRRK
jgi:hypothetical protein